MITVIMGTEIKGCTYHLKEAFIEDLGEHQIKEFVLPKDQPHFCIGCKRCFLEGEEYCPHYEWVSPIFQSILESDLILFAYPVYALRAPGQVKALLDHFCYNWVIHRPKKEFFTKKIAILTQSIGGPNGPAQKDVSTSMNWMGNSNIRKLGFGLMEGIDWDKLSHQRKESMIKKVKGFAEYYKNTMGNRRGVKGKVLFNLGKSLRKNVIKTEETRSYDSQYWLDQGWISDTDQ